jgi:4-hydroxy-tetrahydrodipicolinate reductase
MIKIIISGANGYMGQVVAKIASDDPDVVVVCGVDKFADKFQNDFPVYESYDKIVVDADVLIDFSRPDALKSILDFVDKKRIAAVLCTTGYSKEEQEMIKEKSKSCTLFQSANMSLGVNIQMDLIQQVAEFLGHDYDIEIIERHHNRKVDAPSGTALALADCLNDAFKDDMNYVCGRHTRQDKRENLDIGIHAVRGGTVVGEHEVLFLGKDEIIEVSHRALSRQIFAVGAVRAAKFIKDKPNKLYEMKDILSQQRVITNMYFDKNQAMVTLSDIPTDPLTIAGVFKALGKSGVIIDIITQNSAANSGANISFSLSKEELGKAENAMNSFISDLRGAKKTIFKDITKITVEGMGMNRHSGVAARLFSALALDNISIKLISTSETKIAFCVESDDSRKALSLISKTFDI